MDRKIIHLLPHELKPEYSNRTWGASWELWIIAALILVVIIGAYLVLV